MAGPAPEQKFDKAGNPIEEKDAPPWVPTWYPLKTVGPALVLALEKGISAERGDVIRTLTRLYKHNLGYNPKGWQALVDGAAIETIERKELPVRRLFGVPLFGSRMIVIVDNSNQTDDPHGYSRERLNELCAVPGARPVPWFQIKTKRDFARAWVRRWISDLPKGTRFDLYLVAKQIDAANDKMASVSTGREEGGARDHRREQAGHGPGSPWRAHEGDSRGRSQGLTHLEEGARGDSLRLQHGPLGSQDHGPVPHRLGHCPLVGLVATPHSHGWGRQPPLRHDEGDSPPQLAGVTWTWPSNGSVALRAHPEAGLGW